MYLAITIVRRIATVREIEQNTVESRSSDLSTSIKIGSINTVNHSCSLNMYVIVHSTPQPPQIESENMQICKKSHRRLAWMVQAMIAQTFKPT
jgi:hypothetical protein